MSVLSLTDADLFFKLYGALHLYVNEQLHVLPDVHTPEELAGLKLEDRAKLRDALYDHPELFDRFITENPAGLTADELNIVKSWSSGFIRGDFYIVRHLKRYSIFIITGEADARLRGGRADRVDRRQVPDFFPSGPRPGRLAAFPGKDYLGRHREI